MRSLNLAIFYMGGKYRIGERSTLSEVAPGFISVGSLDWRAKVLTEEGKLRDGIFDGNEPLIPNRLIDVLTDELSKATDGGRILVLKGERGIGKTVAAHVALLRFAEELEKRDQKVVIVDVYDTSLWKYDIVTFIERANKLDYTPVLYLDNSELRSYTYRDNFIAYGLCKDLDETKKMASMVVNAVVKTGKGIALIVAPNELYYATVEDALANVDKGSVHVIDGDAVLEPEKVEFLERLAYEHCKCADAKTIAKAVAERFGDSYTVAAAIAGRLVGRGTSVEKALKEAERAVLLYALDYIWSAFSWKEREQNMRHAMPAMLAIGLLGSWPPELTADVMAKMATRAYGAGSVKVNELVLKFFKAVRPGSSLYEALREAARAAACRAFYACEDALCGGSSAFSCEIVEKMEDFLYWLRLRAKSLEGVAERYARLIEDLALKHSQARLKV